MPAQSEWLHRVKEICQEVTALEVPVVDRAAVEQIFRLRRRQAIELMHRFGGYQAGRAFVLDRVSLVRSLENLQSGSEFEQERRRKERIIDKLDKARRDQASARVRIPVTVEMLSQRAERLPEAIRCEDGVLTIRFDSVQELLEHLVELSQAASNDFEGFQGMAERRTGA